MFAFYLRAKKWHTLTLGTKVLAFVLGTSFSLLSFADSDHGHGHELEEQNTAEQSHASHHDDHEQQDEHGHDDSITLDPATAAQSKITTAIVSSGKIAHSERLYGKVVNDATQISHIGARFAGTIMQVNVNIGDSVKKGQALARIESNQSLHPYIVKAPFSGIITDRHANPGELTQDQPLFTLFNDAILWAEFKIFPAHMRTVKAGQHLIIDNERFTIAHIIPSPNDAPYSLARVRLDNHDHGWSAGIVLKADVITQEKNVSLRVANQALQTLEGKTVVFVKQSNAYVAKPIVIGLQDAQYSEVLSGIEAGDEVVVNNSYVIKADFEKSGAEHVH